MHDCDSVHVCCIHACMPACLPMFEYLCGLVTSLLPCCAVSAVQKSVSALPDQCACACIRSEKNWAFLEHGNKLIVFYSLLPCTVMYVFNPKAPKGAVYHSGYCYENHAEVCPAPGSHLMHDRPQKSKSFTP